MMMMRRRRSDCYISCFSWRRKFYYTMTSLVPSFCYILGNFTGQSAGLFMYLVHGFEWNWQIINLKLVLCPTPNTVVPRTQPAKWPDLDCKSHPCPIESVSCEQMFPFSNSVWKPCELLCLYFIRLRRLFQRLPCSSREVHVYRRSKLYNGNP